MEINWAAYTYEQYDGYGRYSSRWIAALLRAGVDVKPLLVQHATMPHWLLAREGVRWDRLTIFCMPPYRLNVLGRALRWGSTAAMGRHWLMTMTEGSELPDGWAEMINESGIERVIVPCRHNQTVFVEGGVRVPVHVVGAGTDPNEFPLLLPRPELLGKRPYTFLALADRGERKGWAEVHSAFYKAFGSAKSGVQDVRLLLKARPTAAGMLADLLDSDEPDPRVVVWTDDVEDAADIYAQADCVALPSRCEGWGMPHREAAMMGLPVITQRYSGMDDGHTDQWAIVVEAGYMARISSEMPHIKGQWRRVDTLALAAAMRRCYEDREWASARGAAAAQWLRTHQTWDQAVDRLFDVMMLDAMEREAMEAVYAA